MYRECKKESGQSHSFYKCQPGRISPKEGTMPRYVKRKDSDTWHWCTNCSNYPTGLNVNVSYKKPTYGELCDECQAKEKEDRCTG